MEHNKKYDEIPKSETKTVENSEGIKIHPLEIDGEEKSKFLQKEAQVKTKRSEATTVDDTFFLDNYRLLIFKISNSEVVDKKP